MYILQNPKRMSLSLSKKLPFAVLKTPTSFPPHIKIIPTAYTFHSFKRRIFIFHGKFCKVVELKLERKKINSIQKQNQGKSFFFGLFLEVKVNEFPIKLFPNIPTIYIVGNESKS